MRLLPIVVLGVAGYFGYNYYIDHKEEVDQQVSGLVAKVKGESAPIEDDAEPVEAPPLDMAITPQAPPPPEFSSKIEAPEPAAGEKQYAPPGVFYVIERVSVMSTNGVKAVSPGEKVKLLQRKSNGTMVVTTGSDDFEVKESQVTNDLDIAREAEKRDFVARGGIL